MVEATAELYNENVNLDNDPVEVLVQRLEAMEKNNEQIKRENQLFESYLLRKQKLERRSDEQTNANAKLIKQRFGDKPPRLTPEQKYEIASTELEQLKSNIEEGRDKSETLLERLKAILEGTDLSIAEIRKEAFDFGRFLSAAENGRIGKYDAEKLSKYMFDKLKQKEQLIDKLQSKNYSLKGQILKAETQIKHKDEMGDDLKFIDFHQLQIENKKFVKDIDDRNKTLLKLKTESGVTVQTLNKIKKQLTDALSDAVGFDKKMKVQTDSLAKKENDINKSTAKLKKINFENKKLTNFKSMQGEEMDNAKEFVEKKNEYMGLVKKKKDIQRQIEIAELEAKKARRILKQVGDTTWLQHQQQEMA